MVIKLTNFEKYYEEIIKLHMCDYMVTYYGEVFQCREVEDNCDSVDCIFNRLKHCDIDGKRAWLFNEFAPALSYSEMIFVDKFKEEGWLARDKDGSLYLYFRTPIKGPSSWVYSSEIPACIEIDKTHFKFISWEDEKPVPLSFIKTLYDNPNKDNNDDE